MPSPPMPALSTTSICALLCCHNRRSTTLAALAALQASTGLAGVTLSAVLVDDGSTDGTAEAVMQAYPWVTVLRGDGTLFWCRSMHLAFASALRESHDHYFWLNDDTFLHPGALAQMLATAQERASSTQRAVIVVGSTTEPNSNTPSYGGRGAANRWRPLAWPLVPPSEVPQAVATFDGNLVLVSDAAAAIVGNLDPAFEHAMADYDYGLRAAQLGVGLWIAPGVQGECARNAAMGGFNDTALPRRQRLAHMLSRKGLPWRSWLRFTRRHAGVLWWLRFASPYVRVLLGLGRRMGVASPSKSDKAAP